MEFPCLFYEFPFFSGHFLSPHLSFLRPTILLLGNTHQRIKKKAPVPTARDRGGGGVAAQCAGH